MDELIPNTDTKTCSSCKVEKALDKFSKYPRNRGPKGKGVSSWCLECCAAKVKARRSADPEKYRARNREWNKKNPDCQRNCDLRKNYGISLEFYNQLYAEQGGKCAICGSDTPDASGRRKVFSVDHDHETGQIRGLLCVNCNSALGMLNEDIALLHKAVEYLLRYRRVEILTQIKGLNIRDLAKSLMEKSPGMCYQRAIREVVMAREGMPEGAPTSMDGAYVTQITNKQAEEVILKYEWLGTMGRPQASYGLWLPVNGVPTLAGVACFGLGSGRLSGGVCGEEYIPKAIALERGTCVHWAPKNAASWFVPKAVAMASKDHGWDIFYAYSDPEAGEVGTIYQACNWLYLGIGPGHGPTRNMWVRPDGVTVTSRVLRARKMKTQDALNAGWKKKVVAAKGKYVWFEGSHGLKRKMRKLLVHPVVPYPKRDILDKPQQPW